MFMLMSDTPRRINDREFVLLKGKYPEFNSESRKIEDLFLISVQQSRNDVLVCPSQNT